MVDRKRNRLKDFDYSQGYWYFITVCVNDMITYFGKVVNGKMILNKYGIIVEEKWIALNDKYNDVQLDQFIVMPNHFHGIITFNNVRTTHELSLRQKPKTLSHFIGEFKMQSSKQIHLCGLKKFKWQRSLFGIIIKITLR